MIDLRSDTATQPTPGMRAAIAAAIVGVPADDEAVGEVIGQAKGRLASLDVVDDLNGSADYKLHLAGVLLERAARTALREARNA